MENCFSEPPAQQFIEPPETPAEQVSRLIQSEVYGKTETSPVGMTPTIVVDGTKTPQKQKAE